MTDLGLPEGFGYPRLMPDDTSGMLVVWLRQVVEPHHGGYWYRRFDERQYHLLCGYPVSDLNYRDAVLTGAEGLLAVNVWATAHLPDATCEEVAVGWDWHGLALFDLTTGKEVRLIDALSSHEETVRMWISEVLRGSDTGDVVVASVAFEYAKENGSFVLYRLCEVSLETGACHVLTDLPAVFA